MAAHIGIYRLSNHASRSSSGFHSLAGAGTNAALILLKVLAKRLRSAAVYSLVVFKLAWPKILLTPSKSPVARSRATAVVWRIWGAPHIRHSKAMGMLKAGINLIYIRDFLGHVNVTSTEVYARADNEMKRKYLEQSYQDLNPQEFPNWEDDKTLLAWLNDLCR